MNADPNRTEPNRSAAAAVSSRGAWMALVAAVLGWLFDGFEIGMFPLTGQPALAELLPEASQEVRDQWFGVITAVFLIGAATGGVLFGWLGDRIGRVRAMSASILAYAIFTGLCGFATEAWHIAVLRFVASLGMGGEWSLGVALVNEIWPARSRAFVAGLIGAAANVGMALVALVSLALASDVVHQFLEGPPGSLDAAKGVSSPWLRNGAWRLLMIAGAAPALLIFFIRLAVPESEKWKHERDRGATSHWATRDLIGTLIGMLAACGMVAVWSPLLPESMSPAARIALRAVVTPLGIGIALWGFLLPVRKYLTRAGTAGDVTPDQRRTILGRLLLGAGLSGVALMGTWGSLQWAAKWAGSLTKDGGPVHAKEYTQLSLALGAVVGTIAAALIADRIGRRLTYALLCLGSTASLLVFYQANDGYGSGFLASVFVAGGVTAAFYGWFPLYLPELFPTSIRATSQGFAYNFGRVLAAVGTLQTAPVIALFDGSFSRAGSALSAIYLVGAVLIWFGPETKGRPLPE